MKEKTRNKRKPMGKEILNFIEKANRDCKLNVNSKPHIILSTQYKETSNNSLKDFFL